MTRTAGSPSRSRRRRAWGPSPGDQLLISFQDVKRNGDYLALWRIKPTSTGFALKKACCLGTGKVSLPPPGTQGGGGVNSSNFWWDAGDLRLVNAFYDADRNQLYAAHTVFKNFKPDTLTGGYPEAGVQWYEVDPASNLGGSILARKGVIGSAEIDQGWPTVATDGSGTLFVTYKRGSSARRRWMWDGRPWRPTAPERFRDLQPGERAARTSSCRRGSRRSRRARPPTRSSSSERGRRGTSNPSGLERWGDFTAINRDPWSVPERRDLQPVRVILDPVAAVHRRRHRQLGAERDRYPEPP